MLGPRESSFRFSGNSTWSKFRQSPPTLAIRICSNILIWRESFSAKCSTSPGCALWRGMYTRDDFERAASIVYAAMPPTPQYAWPLLAEETQCECWVKHENHTPI